MRIARAALSRQRSGEKAGVDARTHRGNKHLSRIYQQRIWRAISGSIADNQQPTQRIHVGLSPASSSYRRAAARNI